MRLNGRVLEEAYGNGRKNRIFSTYHLKKKEKYSIIEKIIEKKQMADIVFAGEYWGK